MFFFSVINNCNRYVCLDVAPLCDFNLFMTLETKSTFGSDFESMSSTLSDLYRLD